MWGFYFDIETNELISNPYELGEQCSPCFTEELFLNHHPSLNYEQHRVLLEEPMCPARFKQSPYDISCMNSSMYYVGVALVLLCLLNL